MKQLFRPVLSAFLLSFLILLSLTGCGGSATRLLAYQKQPLHLIVAFERGGVSYRGEVTLAAGGDGRDMTLTYLAPDTLSGVTYVRENGQVTVSYGEIRQAAPSDVLLPFDLFAIPEGASVTSIEQVEGERVATLTADGAVYTLIFRGDSTVPVLLSRSSDGSEYLAVTVEEVLS